MSVLPEENVSEKNPKKTADFRSDTFLIEHIKDTMNFYHPSCIDNTYGGFIQHFRDDGTIYDYDIRHLVSSCRFIFNYAMAASQLDLSSTKKEEYVSAIEHGIDFLRQHHRNNDSKGYAWVLNKNQISDDTNHCYGLAFVLLAYASAIKAGVHTAKAHLEETFAVMEEHFWSSENGLYSDEISADWQTVSPYRGQNSNMHSCEALIAAYEATLDERYLDRAFTIAHNICVRLTKTTDGMIWEHYHTDWSINWDYNRDDPRHLFRPWGFQPGHLTEWAKLLLMLEKYRPEAWLLPRATELFDCAMEKSWDTENGGICYGFDLEGNTCDGDKYFWVQAESFAAAALLAKRTGDEKYWEWYDRIWQYSWTHFVDHQYGAWFRILTNENEKYDEFKSPAGKTDYHTMGACYEVLRSK